MPASARPRRLGRISPQAEDYVRAASDQQFAAVKYVLDCLVSGDAGCWDTLPQSELLTTGQFGRMVTLLSTGHVMVWRDYADHPGLFVIYYLGPASSFF